jgi:hypothetical protein
LELLVELDEKWCDHTFLMPMILMPARSYQNFYSPTLKKYAIMFPTIIPKSDDQYKYTTFWGKLVYVNQ